MPNDDEYYSALARWTSLLRLLQSEASRAARAQDLHLSHYLILLQLLGWPTDADAPTIRDISDRLGFVHHATIGLLATLVDRNLVRRTKTATHVFLALTPSGRALITRMADDAKPTLEQDIGAIHTATHQLMRELGVSPHTGENGNGPKQQDMVAK